MNVVAKTRPVTRIARLQVFAGIAVLATACWLTVPMWFQHDAWLARSFHNRSAFRGVPARRGTVRDAAGRELAEDLPGFDLELRYHTFRRQHPVGIALHGAQLLDWARSGWRGRERVDGTLATELPRPTLRYADAPDAARALLGVTMLELRRDGPFPRTVSRDLRFYSAAFLAAVQAGSRRQCAKVLQAGIGQAGPASFGALNSKRLGDLLGADGERAAIADVARRLAELREFGVRCLDEAVPGDDSTLDRMFESRVLSVQEILAGDPEMAMLADLEARRASWRRWDTFERLPRVERRALRDPLYWAWLGDEVSPELRDLLAPMVGLTVPPSRRGAGPQRLDWRECGYLEIPAQQRETMAAAFTSVRSSLNPEDAERLTDRAFLRFLSDRAGSERDTEREREGAVAVTEAAYKDSDVLARRHPWRRFAALRRRERAEVVAAFEAAQRDGRIEVGLGRLERPSLPWNEDVPWTVARRLAFEFAAYLGRLVERHPGLAVRPSVRRSRAVLPGFDDLRSLEPILGDVHFYSRAEAVAARAEEVFRDTRAESVLTQPLEAMPELLGQGVLESAQSSLRRHLERFGRSGTRGIERALDPVLRGDPGLRWIQHDRSARENKMLRQLDVAPGRDVVLTLDLERQAIAEQVLAGYADKGVVQAAAVLDAETGDVLVLVGAPLEDSDGVPYWRSVALFPPYNLDVGSVVKPFVLLEHLDALRFGREHAENFPECDGVYRETRPYVRCGGAHWGAARDPVRALAKSCNEFFCHATAGLGKAGLRRALSRAGWCQPMDAAAPDRRQLEIFGLGTNDHHWATHDESRLALTRRGIGYGTNVNVLQVARAYAGLATGVLPEVSIVQLEGRPRRTLPLQVHPDDLALVREGMRACVESGTARSVAGLRRLGAFGKTGTAEVVRGRKNNAWFAGFCQVPWYPRPVAFAAAAYLVEDGQHGGDVAGEMIADILEAIP